MIPRVPSLFHVEEGEAATARAPMPATSGELVGLRLIIQPSPRQQRRQQPLAVLRRSALRLPAPSASELQGISSDQISFVGLEFLKSCLFCLKKIDGDMDVFLYKGDQAFCSGECRCRQMAKEERREMEIMARKRRDAFHGRHQRVAPASIRPERRRDVRRTYICTKP